MACLLDTNILVRWAQPSAPEYGTIVQAVETLRDQGEVVVITPQNLVEYWNVATRPASVNGLGLSPADVEQRVKAMEFLFPLLPDIPAVHTEWRRLVVSAGVSGKQVHDARLVAVMQAHGVTRLMTLNGSDFRRYAGISVIHPPQVTATP